MRKGLLEHMDQQDDSYLRSCAADQDTHLRKWTYLLMGRIYKEKVNYGQRVLKMTRDLMSDQDYRVRQTAVYIAGEIGDFSRVEDILKQGLVDRHHAVRNGVIGALKVMGKRNPKPTIAFARRYLHHEDPEVRREIIHGIELRGRTHPEDILPLLREAQKETNKRVIKMIAHVLGQCSYKEGCLGKVVEELAQWKNVELVQKAVDSILDIHRNQRYCFYTYEEAGRYIRKQLGTVID